LEEAIAVRGSGLPLGRQAMPDMVSDPPGTYNDERLITFLRNLKKHLRGQRAMLIWDDSRRLWKPLNSVA
jgi:hypothetical protein